MSANEQKASLNVLLVIDEPFLTRAIQKKLNALGYAVDVANDAMAAWQMINDKNYLLVISDFNLKGMSGGDLLKRIKDYNGMTRVILLFDEATLDDFLGCFRQGVDDCFFKPLVNLEPLQQSIDEAIRRLEKWNLLMQEIVSRKRRN